MPRPSDRGRLFTSALSSRRIPRMGDARMGRFYSDNFVQKHLSLKSTCDTAGRIWHDLFSIFPICLHSDFLGPNPVRSGQGGNVPLATPRPQELFPPEATLAGDRLSGRSAGRFSRLVRTPPGGCLVAHPLPGAGLPPPSASLRISPHFLKSHFSVLKSRRRMRHP